MINMRIMIMTVMIVHYFIYVFWLIILVESQKERDH
jgi:hypothetical protein